MIRAKLCVVPQSFNFSAGVENLTLSLGELLKLRDKMASDFIVFKRSNDFYIKIAEEFNSASIENGWAMSFFFDGLNKINEVDLSVDELFKITNSTPPVHDDRWVSLYNSREDMSLMINKKYSVSNERELVDYCTYILTENKREHSLYSKQIQEVYKNIIFLNYPDHAKHKTFDSLRKMDGGYKNFQGSISRFLSFANSYQVIPNDSLKNIEKMNASSLEFPVTPEGKGKTKRPVKDLKRDFFINEVVYKDINCEFHYKLERIDGANGNGQYFFNRIYFGFFKQLDPKKPKICIAHIGEHL
ncbi:hypothetical protein JTL32_07690 [Enterobacter cloacae]|nr:hypothetical protein [Enterobacter cloacae]